MPVGETPIVVRLRVVRVEDDDALKVLESLAWLLGAQQGEGGRLEIQRIPEHLGVERREHRPGLVALAGLEQFAGHHHLRRVVGRHGLHVRLQLLDGLRVVLLHVIVARDVLAELGYGRVLGQQILVDRPRFGELLLVEEGLGLGGAGPHREGRIRALLGQLQRVDEGFLDLAADLDRNLSRVEPVFPKLERPHAVGDVGDTPFALGVGDHISRARIGRQKHELDRHARHGLAGFVYDRPAHLALAFPVCSSRGSRSLSLSDADADGDE